MNQPPNTKEKSKCCNAKIIDCDCTSMDCISKMCSECCLTEEEHFNQVAKKLHSSSTSSVCEVANGEKCKCGWARRCIDKYCECKCHSTTEPVEYKCNRCGNMEAGAHACKPTEPKKTVERCTDPKGNEICTNGKDTYHNFNMKNFNGCNFCTPIQTGSDEWEEEFDKLDVHISPPKSLADEELREKIKFFLPIAFDLLKPSIKSFIRSSIQKAVLQERESIKKLLQKECLDDCMERNGYDYCKNCGLSLDLLDNKQ